MEYRQIEIDVEVNRWIESKRESFSQTYNDILRAAAGLTPLLVAAVPLVRAPSDEVAPSDVGAWSRKGATIPAGTPLRMSYNGKQFTGVVDNGVWLVNGGRYMSPSAAASTITGVSLNGWIYWHAQLPGMNEWRLIDDLRTHVARRH